MTCWTVEQMRHCVNGGGAFVIGNTTYGDACDWLDLPEHGEHPSQETVPEPDGVLVDHVTANMLVTIYDNLNDQHRQTFAAMPLERAVDVGWKLVEKARR